ncbi:MAG: PD40 domain-containing protein, partial [Chloroflexi bacterium]|nr:PD40 domain-containing protein [Chloroflexota bacterium]
MPHPIGPDYLFEVKTVSDPDLSHDGRRIAFAVSRVDRDTAEVHSRISVVDLPVGHAETKSPGQPFEFTQGNADDMPRWSPDGAQLAFRRPDAQGMRQVWVMASSGGESRQITSLVGGVLEFAWAPDSSRLAVVSDVDPNPPKNATPRTTVARRIRYHEDGVGIRGEKRRHIFIVDLDKGARQITAGDFDNNTPVWSPDGTRIAFISARSEDRDIAAGTEVYVAQVDRSERGSRAEGEGDGAVLWSAGLFNIGGIGWSPDGTKLVVIGSESRTRSGGFSLYSQGWLYVLQPGARPRQISDDSVRPVVSLFAGIPNQELVWTGDGRVFFLADGRGESDIYAVAETGGDLQRITKGGGQITRWSIDASLRRAAVAFVPPASVGEICLIDVPGGQQSWLTAYNDSYFADHPPALLEKFKFSRAGFDIECRVWLPPFLDRSKKYPLLLEIHGGPQGVFYDA